MECVCVARMYDQSFFFFFFFFFFLNISWIEGKGHLLAILVLVPVCLLAQGSSRTTRNFLPT